MIEVMLNLSLYQHTITIILLAGLLHLVNIVELMLNVSLNQHNNYYNIVVWVLRLGRHN